MFSWYIEANEKEPVLDKAVKTLVKKQQYEFVKKKRKKGSNRKSVLWCKAGYCGS